MLQEYWTALMPELILILAGCASLLLTGRKSADAVPVAAPFALLVLAGVSVLSWLKASQIGSLDPLSGVYGLWVGSLAVYVRMVVGALGGLLVLVNWTVPDWREDGEYFAMLLFSCAGVMLCAIANDIVLLFFALELISVPTYVMVAISRTDFRAQEASTKYFFLGALAAAITAYGLSFLYGVTGSTTMFDAPGSISWILASQSETRISAYALLGLVLVIGGIGFKIAAFPFHGYVADVYQGAASPLAGVLAFLPKLGGFVALIQILALLDWQRIDATLMWTLWALAALTMTVGNVLALMQSNIKRMLAYSGIAHSGYMLVGLLVGPYAGSGLQNGIAALLMYMTIYGLMNLGAFTVLGYLGSRRDREVESLEDLSGIVASDFGATICLAICMFSLMGLPPTAGFIGKMYIFSSAFSVGEGVLGHPLVILAVIGFLNSAIGAAYYLRVVGYCFFKEAGDPPHLAGSSSMRFGIMVCALAMFALFVLPQGLMQQTNRAASRLPVPPPEISEAQARAQAVPAVVVDSSDVNSE